MSALCTQCGSEVWFDAYVTMAGEITARFDYTYCPTCEGEASYTTTEVN